MHSTTHFSLEAKYTQESGTVLLSGLQALCRLALDQRRADQRQGLNTAMLIAGYRGSPLGELDVTIQSHQELFTKNQIIYQGAVNEELAATAIYGSQFANHLPNPKYDGVLGMWYGKAPGVDRSGDVFKHANFAGVGRYGGVLALAGDDPAAKSSTLPSHSEVELYSALMPILYPGSVQEVLDLGRYGFELSRYSGLWVGFKVVTNVADGFDTAEVGPNRITICRPDFQYMGKPWQHTQGTVLLAPQSVRLEKEIYEGRLEAAKAFIAANEINKIGLNPSQAWIGIVAAGKTYLDVRQALWELGLDDDTLMGCGVRLLKLNALFPLESGIVQQFARGLEEILVIEEKASFIEMFLRDELYNLPDRPRIVGKKDENGKPLVRMDSELDSDAIAPILAARLNQRLAVPSIDARLAELKRPRGPLTIQLLPRQPYFCSGCPHNRSTVVPEGSLSSGGIGCHTMVLMMPERLPIGITQMGGEGVNWVGMAPFTEVPHIFQNIGDGTLFHSGTLAIRQAVASDANITYKILYNSAVAMTGGQTPDGGMTVPELTRELQSEGVRRILVLSNDPHKYAASTHWAPGVEIWDRDRLEEAQEILSKTTGVTALIYDQECAAELRRKRKRGLAPDPAQRIFINEAVCEGCGDCGHKSNCLSVHPVETEFGRKTQIHQSSCNKDYSCIDGNCPAFISVIPREGVKKTPRKLFTVDVDLPEPTRKVGDECNVYLMGIGGTGVVTTNQILGTAALLDGKYIRGLDQTGLSQKGGPVVSHLKIMNDERETSNKLAVGEADCYLVFDVLTATTEHSLRHARPDKTVAIVSTSEVPTGAMVSSTKFAFPSAPSLIDSIEESTRKADNVYLDAIGIAEALFDNHMAANMIVIGAAYQAGLLPISAESLEDAIELNGTAIEMNRQAFRVGRRIVADPAWVTTIQKKRIGALEIKPEISPEAQSLIDSVGAPEGELLRLLRIRVPELIAYQNAAYARKYVDFVRHVRNAEQTVTPGETRLSETVAQNLFKLMAFKDEYEVARLSLKPEVRQALVDEFGGDAEFQYLLHPPILKAFGLKHKVRLGAWFMPIFNLLTRMKFLRFTPLDIFGYDKIRRTERALIGQYRDLIEQALVTLNGVNYERAVRLAALPDQIRGYDDIKLANVALFWEEVKKIGSGAPRPSGQPIVAERSVGD